MRLNLRKLYLSVGFVYNVGKCHAHEIRHISRPRLRVDVADKDIIHDSAHGYVLCAPGNTPAE